MRPYARLDPPMERQCLQCYIRKKNVRVCAETVAFETLNLRELNVNKVEAVQWWI